MSHPDVLVIGAGVIGSSIAYQLSKDGHSVLVIDCGGPGSGASGACDQAIFLQSKRPGVHLRLALASRRMYDDLEEDLDADLELRRSGGMVVAESEQHADFMRGFVRRQRDSGVDLELLDGATARAVQPRLGPTTVAATHSPMDAEVSPLLLNAALLAAAQRHGARVLRHVEMCGVLESAGRISGVRTGAGDMSAGLVVNAAGPYAGVVGERAGIPTPVRPRRGTILITEPLPPMLNGVLLCAHYVAAKHVQDLTGEIPPFGIGMSLGQTAAGNLLIGGSREYADFDRDVPSAVRREIARHAIGIIPDLKQIRVLRAMTGFRPATGDGLPVIEISRPGWITAAGHEGDGIALAPITGRLVLDLVHGASSTHPFLPDLSGDRPSLHPSPQKEVAS